MGDLIAFVAALLVLAGFGSTAAEAGRCRPLPPLYCGGIDLADRPPTSHGGRT